MKECLGSSDRAVGVYGKPLHNNLLCNLFYLSIAIAGGFYLFVTTAKLTVVETTIPLHKTANL